MVVADGAATLKTRDVADIASPTKPEDHDIEG
jgi:hypothetical protein